MIHIDPQTQTHTAPGNSPGRAKALLGCQEPWALAWSLLPVCHFGQSQRKAQETNQLLLSTPANQQLKETQGHSYGCCPGWIVGRTNKAISKEFPTCSDMKVITVSDWHERGSPGKARLPGASVTASVAVLIRNQLQVKYVDKEETQTTSPSLGLPSCCLHWRDKKAKTQES